MWALDVTHVLHDQSLCIDPVRVDMESASEPSGPEAETESIISAVPASEVGSDMEVDVESEADAPVAEIRLSAHIQAGFVMKVSPVFFRGA